MYIALFESLNQINNIMMYMTCSWHLNELLAWTLFQSNSYYYLALSLDLLAQSGTILLTVGLTTTVMLNTMLCLDMILMVRDPFTKSESRMPIYITIVCLGNLVIAPLLAFNQGSEIVFKIGIWMFTVITTFYVVIFFFSAVYAWMKLGGPGMNKEVRLLVMKRHIITGLFFTFSNTYLVWTNIWTVLGGEYIAKMNTTDPTVFMMIFKLIWACQGFFLPLGRVFEPYFFKVCADALKDFCCCGNHAKKLFVAQERYDNKFVERANEFSSDLTPLLAKSIQDENIFLDI